MSELHPAFPNDITTEADIIAEVSQQGYENMLKNWPEMSDITNYTVEPVRPDRLLTLEGDNYLYIHCLWVSGSFKGHGYADDLLDECINDAKKKGRSGLCVLSSEKKRPFLSDPGYLKYRGFEVTDKSDPGILLMTLKWDNKAKNPQFKESARHPKIKEKGFVLYYTGQCPFNGKYVPILEKTAEENGIGSGLVVLGMFLFLAAMIYAATVR